MDNGGMTNERQDGHGIKAPSPVEADRVNS